MHYWALSEIRHAEHTKEPCRLLWPAYAFGDAQFFNSFTKFMVLGLPNDSKAQSASARYGIPEDVGKYLPESVLGKSLNKLSACIVILTLKLTKRPYSLLKETSRGKCRSKSNKASVPSPRNARRVTSSQARTMCISHNAIAFPWARLSTDSPGRAYGL